MEREQSSRQVGWDFRAARRIGRRAAQVREQRVLTQKGLHRGGAEGAVGKVLAEQLHVGRRQLTVDQTLIVVLVGARIDGWHGKLRIGPGECPRRSTTETANPYAPFSDLFQQPAQMLAQPSEDAAVIG